MPKLHLSSSIIHSSLFIVHYSLFIVLSLLLISCTSSTNPKTGSLTGQVILVNDTDDSSHDPVDFSGVTVALYKLAVLDTTIVRINQEYPQVGVQISQETEFDHRLCSPAYLTTTNAEGEFGFESVEISRYNLVFTKIGWGTRYVFDVEVNEEAKHTIEIDQKEFNDHNNSKSSTSDVTMYPVVYLPSVIDYQYQFLSDHVYVVASDVIFVAPVVFCNAATIVCNVGRDMTFTGSLSFPDEGIKWKITASIGFFEAIEIPSFSGSMFGKIEIDSSTSDSNISNGIISYTQEGLRINADNFGIFNMYLMNSGTAVVNYGQIMLFKDCLVRNCTDRATYIYGSASMINNIFQGNHDAVILDRGDYIFQNNYIVDNWVGLRPIYGNTHILNNVFYRNNYAISLLASSPLIEYNNFLVSERYCIQTQPNYVQDYYEYCSPIISSNNFYKTTGIVISLSPDEHPGYFGSGNIGVNNNLDARNNYWKATNVPDVLLDAEDSAEINYLVDYYPKRNSPVANSGITQ